MLWFLLFSNPFAKKLREDRNPTWGDEFMMGNWSISSHDIQNNETKASYQLYLMPHMTEDALIGFFASKDADEPFSYNVSLRFKGQNRDKFTAFFVEEDGSETEITTVEFTYGDNQLLVAFGSFLNTNLTYSANMFSDKTMEVTVFDKGTGEFTLFRGRKPDIHPQQSSIKKYLYMAAIMYYLYSRNKDKVAADAAKQGNNEATHKAPGRKGKKKRN